MEWSVERRWKPLRRAIRPCVISWGCGCAGRRKLTLRCLAAGHGGLKSVPERSNAKDPAPLKVKEVWVKERRYIVCLNEEERRKDAHDREAILAASKGATA